MNYELSFTVTGENSTAIAREARGVAETYFASEPRDDAPTGPVAAYEYAYEYRVRPLVQHVGANYVDVWEADVTVRLVSA